MKPGDVVRLRKSHPAVKRWRRTFQRYGTLAIGKWAEEGAPLLLLEQVDYSDTRWEVLGPAGELASFDDFLMITRGMTK
jgi:hypothetical protein|tara:strand:- start:101 stop:337 length:237 start_codon:yes stop_codon:yes gene_type:complete